MGLIPVCLASLILDYKRKLGVRMPIMTLVISIKNVFFISTSKDFCHRLLGRFNKENPIAITGSNIRVMNRVEQFFFKVT